MTPAPKETPTTMSMLDHALALAHMGFHVFPIIENGRTPAIIGFPQRATRDEAQIRAWWVETDTVMGVTREREYNVGISTTRFGDDQSLLAVDVDVKKGKAGAENLAYLDMMEGVPPTLTAATPSGGQHLFYVVPEPLKTGVNVLGDGLDTRSGGGYVLGAGSRTDVGEYRWANTTPIQPAPAWMAARVGKTIKRENTGTAQVIELLDTQPAVARATEYLLQHAPVAIKGHGGDATTYKVACAVKDMGVSELTCLELMFERWNPRCPPGWAWERLGQKVSNAYHYGTKAIGSNVALPSDFEPVSTPKGEADELFPDPEAAPPRTVADLGLEDIEAIGEDELTPDRWVLGDVLCRGYVTALVSSGGIGKTALEIAMAGGIASGRVEITGMPVHEAGNVLILNNEDDNGILRKRWHALKRLHEIQGGAKHRVIIKGGAAKPIRLAKQGSDGFVKATDDVRLIKDAIRENDIKVLVIDPLVEFHACDENNNVHMNGVLSILRAIAVECDVAVLVVHHTRKPPQADATGHRGNLDSARGGSSFGGNVRRAFTLSEMTEEEAKRYCVRDDERFSYIVLDDAKGNHVRRSAQGRWFKKEGVRIATLEEVVAVRPVREGEFSDRTANLASVVAGEILDIAQGDGVDKLTMNDAVTRLVARAMFSDKAREDGRPKSTFAEQVEAAFATPVAVGGFTVRLVVGAKLEKGSNATKWFVIEAGPSVFD